MKSFPERILRKFTYFKSLTVADFSKMKELPNEPLNQALECLHIVYYDEPEYFPEKMWKGLRFEHWKCLV